MQEDILATRGEVAGLKLRRAAASESPSAPFPITLEASVEPPHEAERFDVSCLPLTVTLRPSLAAAAAACTPRTQQEQPLLGGAVDVRVGGNELPTVLRTAIARELHVAWLQEGPGEGGRPAGAPLV